MIKKVSCLFVMSLLFACGGKDGYVSVDKSADYKAAQSRPPLRKLDDPSVTPRAPSQVQTNIIENTQTSQIMPIFEDGDDLRLTFNSGLPEAWRFLSKELIELGVTVYERNETARYFVIACADVGVAEISERTEPVQESRWVIFRKDVEKQSDNCSVRLTSEKDYVMAAVYNQYGQVVNTESTRQIFMSLAGQ